MFVSDIKPADDRSPWGDFWFQPVGTRAASGTRVTPESALRLSAVYGCIRVLAETMACLPFCMYRPREDGGKDPVTDHWLYRLIAKRPNDWQTSFEWIEMLAGHLALRGNCYNEIVPGRRGEIAQLIPLHPDRMKLVMLDNGSFRWDVTDRNGNVVPYSRHSIWHVRGISSDGYLGMNPIAVAREAIGLGLAAQDYGSRFFANDAKPGGGWIEFAGSFKDKPARDTFRQSWQEAQGGSNRGKIAVLENGMKYHDIGMNNKDSQFLEARQFQVPEICRLFRVPPHMIADLTRSTNNNIEWQSLEFVKFTMTPWVERWEASIEYSLLPEDEDLEIEFDFDNLERGDMKTRSEYYTSGTTAGWLTRNEVRKKENLNPIAGLDKPLEPMNMQGAGKKPSPKDPPQQPQDDGQGDNQDDSSSARLQVLAMAAAERVARKECEQVQRAIKVSPGELLAMYGKHAHFVAKCLAVSIEHAQAYCAGQLASLDPAEEVDAFETRTRCALERLALAGADAFKQGDMK